MKKATLSKKIFRIFVQMLKRRKRWKMLFKSLTFELLNGEKGNRKRVEHLNYFFSGKRLGISVFLLILFIFSGCTKTLPYAVGERDKVVFIAPQDEQKVYENIKPYMEKDLFLPSRESVFRVMTLNSSQLDQYKFWRHILLVGWKGTFLDTLLDGKIDSGGIFFTKDSWTRGQCVVAVYGKNKKYAEKLLRDNGEHIFQIFRDFAREQIESALYRERFQEKKTREMMERYGFSVNIPMGYQVSVKGRNVISYIRHYPDRLFTIYFEEGMKNWTPEEKRNEIFKEYFDGDSVLPRYTNIKDTIFIKRKSKKIEGIWENTKLVMGGPFFSYIFYDENLNRTYFIDCHIFSPEKKKWPYLDELNAIIKTFREE